LRGKSCAKNHLEEKKNKYLLHPIYYIYIFSLNEEKNMQRETWFCQSLILAVYHTFPQEEHGDKIIKPRSGDLCKDEK
jgi:hypothetical protein